MPSPFAVLVVVLILAFQTVAASPQAPPCNQSAFPNVHDCSMTFSNVPNVTIRGVRLVNVFIQFTNITNVTLEDVDMRLTKAYTTEMFHRLSEDFYRFYAMIWFGDVSRAVVRSTSVVGIRGMTQSCMFAYRSNLDVANASFDQCGGGPAYSNALSVELGSSANIRDVTFNNSYTLKGGAALFVSQASQLSVSGVSVTNAYSEDNAGAIFIRNTSSILTDVTITNSSARKNGGSVSFSTLSAVLTNIVITNSYSGNCGGAIETYHRTYEQVPTTVTMSNVLVTNSSSKTCGGVFYVDYRTSLNVTNMRIVNASSPSGGSVVVVSGSSPGDRRDGKLTSFTARNMIVSGSHAEYGGFVIMRGTTNATVLLTNVTLLDVTASIHGLVAMVDTTDARATSELTISDSSTLCTGDATTRCGAGDVWWMGDGVPVVEVPPRCYVYTGRNASDDTIRATCEQPSPPPPTNASETTNRTPTNRTHDMTKVRRILADVTYISAYVSPQPALAGEMSIVHRLQLCSSEHFTKLDFGSHPTGAEISGNVYLGALASNSAIVGGVWLVCLVVFAARKGSMPPPQLIAMGIWVHRNLMAGIITPSMYAALYSPHGIVTRIIGIASLLVFIAATVLLLVVVFRPFKATAKEVDRPALNRDAKSFVVFILWRRIEWASHPPTLVKAYGALFTAFDINRHWVAVVDCILSIMLAIVAGFAEATCETLSAAVTAVIVFQLLVLVVLRPHSTTRYLVLELVITVSKLALVVITLKPSEEGDAVSTVLEAVVTIGAVVGGVITVTRMAMKQLNPKPEVEPPPEEPLGVPLFTDMVAPEPSLPVRPTVTEMVATPAITPKTNIPLFEL